MNEGTFENMTSDTHSWFDHPWFKGQAKRIVHNPLPPDAIKKRMQEAFRFSVALRKEFLMGSYIFSTTWYEDSFVMECEKPGRSYLAYTVTGTLVAEGSGSTLHLTVTDTLTSYLPLFLCAFMFIFIVMWQHSWPIFLPIPAFLLARVWFERSTAADSAVELLEQVINNQE